jgi:hypothetical protein
LPALSILTLLGGLVAVVAPPPAAGAAPSQPSGGGFTAVQPARVLDTRTGLGATGRVGPGQSIDVQIAGQAGLPLAGAAAVALNVTVTSPSVGSYVTSWPAGTARPTASSLNFSAGQTVANAVTVKLGAGGRVSLFNAAGTVHLIADVAGWYADNPAVGQRYRSLAPVRLLDSRAANPVGPGESVRVDNISSGLPPGMTAVALNVTVTSPSVGGFFTVYPAGSPRPLASNLNFGPGQTRANFVAVATSATGVEIYNAVGTVHMVVDRLGYWGDAANSRLTTMSPVRVVDTRSGVGAPARPVGPGATLDVDLSGVAGIPEGRPAGVVLNLTATSPTGAGYLTVHPGGVPRPLASNLNFVAGDTVPNQVIVPVDPSGRASIFNSAGSTHVIVDVVGWFDRPVYNLPLDGVNGRVVYETDAVTPADVVIDPSSTYAYIANPGHNRVDVLRLAATRFETPIPVGAVPTGIDMSPSGDRLYVANRGGTNISVVDVGLRAEVGRIALTKPEYRSNQPYSIAVLANAHALVTSTFSGTGIGAAMFEVDLADGTSRVRSDFWNWGATTERTRVKASGDRRSAVVVVGDISTGPVFRYDLATDSFADETGNHAYNGHIGTNQDGSVTVVNRNAYVYDRGLVLQGSGSSCSGAGVALDPAGTTAYSLADGHIAVCDLNRFLAVDNIVTFDAANWYPYLNNHQLALSPDGSTLVGLTESGVTLVRL